MGLPLSRVSSSANSSMFFSTRSASFHSRRPRSLAEIERHAPLPVFSKAARAAATARPTSPALASATWVSTSPVAGLIVSKVFAVSTHSPLMRSLPGLIAVFSAAIITKPLTTEDTETQRVSSSVPLWLYGDLFHFLFSRKRRRALLDISSQAFLGVVGLEQELLVLA